jgi:hypothetical protein
MKMDLGLSRKELRVMREQLEDHLSDPKSHPHYENKWTKFCLNSQSTDIEEIREEWKVEWPKQIVDLYNRSILKRKTSSDSSGENP